MSVLTYGQAVGQHLNSALAPSDLPVTPVASQAMGRARGSVPSSVEKRKWRNLLLSKQGLTARTEGCAVREGTTTLDEAVRFRPDGVA